MMALATGPLEWLRTLQSEPLAWEIGLILAVAGALWLARRLVLRRVGAVLGHGALEDLLLGYEAVFADRPQEAVSHLSRALEAAPQDGVVRELLTKARLRLVEEAVTTEVARHSLSSASGLTENGLFDRAQFAAFLASAPEFRAPIQSWQRVRDALEVNRQHIADLVEEALSGDEAATGEVTEMGEMAALELLRRVGNSGAMEREGGALRRLAVRLGAAGLPAFFAALREPDVAVSGDRSVALEFVRELAERLVPQSARAVASAATSEDHAIRRIAVHVALGSGDRGFLEPVLAVTSRAEILRVRPIVPPGQLAATLTQLSDEHWLWRHLLEHPDRGVLETLLHVARSRPLDETTIALLHTQFAVQALGTEYLELIAKGVCRIDALPKPSRALLLEPLLLAVTDPEASPASRESLAERLREFGNDVVVPLLALVGERPSAVDANVRHVLRSLGRTTLTVARTVFQSLANAGSPTSATMSNHAIRLLCRALAEDGGVAARRLLSELTRDSRLPQVAAIAGEALRRAGDPAGADAEV
ncbi:MAG: hypothetical protein AB7T19_01045 [Planctomycetota bacterium]